jgi:cyclase
MITKRIIPCLDVRDGQVVKGIGFRDHKIVGDIVDLAQIYMDQGADELVFYDITASTRTDGIAPVWVDRIASFLNIPFCVAGGIRSAHQARAILNAGADKISINSPALENPQLITDLADIFGVQCVVVGVDSRKESDGDYYVYQYTGDESKTIASKRRTLDWVQEVQERGAGEIVLNCMNQDGVKNGYDIAQLQKMRDVLNIPLIASGGAGEMAHFKDVFQAADVDGALAASVFHYGHIQIPDLKNYLTENHILCRQ